MNSRFHETDFPSQPSYVFYIVMDKCLIPEM